MSIQLLTGVPGSGKSYKAIEHFVLDALRENRLVFHNIEGLGDGNACLSAIANYLGKTPHRIRRLLHRIPEEEVPTFYKSIPKNCLVVVDEAQNYWYARDYQKNGHIMEWMSKHRHYGCDFVCITQSPENVDTAIRRLVEFTWRFRKAKDMGFSNAFKYRISLGSSEQEKDAYKTGVGRYDKRIFAMYKSYDEGVMGNEKNYGKGLNLFKSPVFIMLYIVAAFTLWALFSGQLIPDFMKAEQANKDELEHVENTPGITSTPSGTPTSETDSLGWLLLGDGASVIEFDSYQVLGDEVLIFTTSHGTLTLPAQYAPRHSMSIIGGYQFRRSKKEKDRSLSMRMPEL